jgi:hypothetical protein
MSNQHDKGEGAMEKQEAAQPKAGRKRIWARFDLPVIRPSSTRNKIARRLV